MPAWLFRICSLVFISFIAFAVITADAVLATCRRVLVSAAFIIFFRHFCTPSYMILPIFHQFHLFIHESFFIRFCKIEPLIAARGTSLSGGRFVSLLVARAPAHVSLQR